MGRKILNLGCGTRTSAQTINIDWSPQVRIKSSKMGDKVAKRLLSGERLDNYNAIEGNLMVHDLRKGIPFESGSIDAVYHSHVLEHIDRDGIDGFLAEIKRVLKPGGVHRIVVPDLEPLLRAYLDSLTAVDAGHGSPEAHDDHVAAFAEQMVRREAAGTSQQPPMRRKLENALLGDARKRGETHQWMWDRVNLAVVLEQAGFHDPTVVDFKTSAIDDWSSTGLDQEPDGSEYRPGSLYMEATR